MKNAEEYELSHKKVEQNCDTEFYPPPKEPSPPVCEHTFLFTEDGSQQSCWQAPYGDECFGKPVLPKFCEEEEYDEDYYS